MPLSVSSLSSCTRFGCLLSGVAWLISSPLAAQTLDQPFLNANRNPLLQLYGLPVTVSAEPVASGFQLLGLRYEIANTSTVSPRDNEAIVLDGETQRLTLDWQIGFGSGWSAALRVPYLGHRGGDWDNFIEEFHDTFGMSNGDRDALPQNQLHYLYRRNGQSLIDLQNAQRGLGDISVELGQRFYQRDQQQLAWRLSVELPTGDADKLLGSESTDVAFGVYFSQWQFAGHQDLSLHASAGVLYSSRGELLPQLQKQEVFFGAATLSWALFERVHLKAQLEANSAAYDSELRELGSTAAQLILGGTLALSENAKLDIALSEDIAVDTAPDAVLQIGISFRY